MGRFLGGAATSLLYSSFESWMVFEHKKRGLPEETRATLFGLVMLGDGIVAMTAGFVALGARQIGGYSGPFDCSVLIVLCGATFIAVSWEENFGNVKRGGSLFGTAIAVLRKHPSTCLLGVITSLFEASMYLFVFLWTKAIQTAADRANMGELPLGLLFSCYMAAVMAGSRVFAILASRMGKYPGNFMVPVLALASSTLFIAAWSSDVNVLFGSFLTFEFCCGVYFPSYGTLRAAYIPEHVRATVMNIFRVPLNAFVATALIISQRGGQSTFAIGGAAIGLAAVLQFGLTRMGRPSHNSVVTPKVARS